MPRQRNHARNPEKFTPRIRATPVRRPIAASAPSVLKLNGVFGAPQTLAIMFRATTFPSREACCAVGGQYLPVAGSGTSAQSPSAQTLSTPSTSRFEFTLIRPRSFGQGTRFKIGFGDIPAVQTNVE